METARGAKAVMVVLALLLAGFGVSQFGGVPLAGGEEHEEEHGEYGEYGEYGEDDDD